MPLSNWSSSDIALPCPSQQGFAPSCPSLRCDTHRREPHRGGVSCCPGFLCPRAPAHAGAGIAPVIFAPLFPSDLSLEAAQLPPPPAQLVVQPAQGPKPFHRSPQHPKPLLHLVSPRRWWLWISCPGPLVVSLLRLPLILSCSCQKSQAGRGGWSDKGRPQDRPLLAGAVASCPTVRAFGSRRC